MINPHHEFFNSLNHSIRSGFLSENKSGIGITDFGICFGLTAVKPSSSVALTK